MAACRYVEEEGEIASVPSRDQPRSLECDSSSGQHGDREHRKRPLHTESHRLGPPRARWKHNDYEPAGGGSQGGTPEEWRRRDQYHKDERWQDRKQDGDRIQQHSTQSRHGHREYARNQHAEARSPGENVSRASQSLNEHREHRRHERERKYNSYRDERRSRQEGSRSSSVSHSHSRSRSSSVSATRSPHYHRRPSDLGSSSGERPRDRKSHENRYDRPEGRHSGIYSRFTSADQNKRPLDSVTPPFKKRWIPPTGGGQTNNGSVAKKDTLGSMGKSVSANVVNRNQVPSQKGQHSISGKKQGAIVIGNAAMKKAPARKTPEKKGLGIFAKLCMAAKTGSGGTVVLSEAQKKKDKKRALKTHSPKASNERNAADIKIPKVSKESRMPSAVKVKDLPSAKRVNEVKGADTAKPQASRDSRTLSEVKCKPATNAIKKPKVDVEATPELTEASLEDCHKERELKACSIVLPAAHHVDPAAIVSESPYSLIHGEPTLEVCESRNQPSQCIDTGIFAAKEASVATAEKEDSEKDAANSKSPAVQPEQNEYVKKPENMSVLDSDTDSSDSDTSSSEDEEEIMRWAQKMFGITPPGLQNPATVRDSFDSSVTTSDDDSDSSDSESDSDVSSLSDHDTTVKRVPPRFQRKSGGSSTPRRVLKISLSKESKGRSKVSGKQKRGKGARTKPRKKRIDTEEMKAARERELQEERLAAEDAKRVKEEAKPLTAAEIKAILGEDDFAAPSNHWVRRSVRQPSKSILSAPKTRDLLEKLRCNDGDMVVLKMKKYLSDPATPSVVIDAALDALEENTNCEALYIQNFNIGMRDEQVLHLLKVLQRPSCRIWCLNIGETYNVKPKTWKKFTNGLKKTKVTHLYASEHTISAEQKEKIRDTIRRNRDKHDMHINPDNLDVIVQCTHCWWNPINAKALRPYLKSRGYEHILYDKEKQGLRGSSSGAPTGKCDAKRLC